MQNDNQPQAGEEVKSQPPQDRQKNMLTGVVIAAAAILFAVRYPSAAFTTLVTLVILGVLIFVHEWGHYQFARWAGMKVNRFGIGFPPWVYTVRRNNIDYSIGALPIGGLVDIAGLGSEEEMVAAGKEKAARVSGKELPDGTRVVEEDTSPSGSGTDDAFGQYRLRNPNAPHGTRQFQDASLGWRFWTLFAGPLMNFLFAIVVFIGLYSVVGLPSAEPLPRIESVVNGSPAAGAGLQQNDTIVAVDGKPTKDTNEIAQAIRASDGKPIILTIERGQETLTKTLTPEWERPLFGEPGEKVPLIGVQFATGPTTYTKVSLPQAVSVGFQQTLFITTQIKDTVVRALTGQLSRMERSGIRGPVGIAEELGKSAREGWIRTTMLAAALSINLGLINLLPLPALDGGRIMFLGYELIMRKPLDPRKEGIAHAVGMVMLLAFMLFITVRDVLPFLTKT